MTWRYTLHPHLHALVPGGGPSLGGGRWVTSRHPTQRNRKKPYLVDNVRLGQRFRNKFAHGFRRLVRAGKLHLEEDWARLREPRELDEWLIEVTTSDWNVFIEGPPNGKSNPNQVLKYLARYMTGGPISDRRIIRDESDRVTFWARSKNKSEGNSPRPFELSGKEFVRRWAMHILPKGYTKSRCFGGYHGGKRRDYLNRCRELLTLANPQPIKPLEPAEEINTEPRGQKCPRCDIEMACIQNQQRPSWKDVFERELYGDPAIYSPLHYCHDTGFQGFPAFPHEPDG